MIAEDLQALGLSYDLFTRTTTRNHYAVVQEIFIGLLRQRLRLPADARSARSRPSTGRTLPDRYIEGTCPICGYDGARGDQCDNCGNQLDPIDLINPRSRINGETPKFVETEHFFLDLPAFAEVLGAWLQSKQGHWRPNVLKFSLNLLDDLQAAGDHPRPRLGRAGAARRLAGPPGQAALRLVRRGHRLPVGVDRVGEAHRRPGRVAAVVADAGRPRLLLHGQGQHRLPLRDLAGDAARLQPATAPRAATPGSLGALDLPSEVVSSEFLTMEGKQVLLLPPVVIYVRDFLSRYDADALRYYLAVAGPETQDTDFTWSEFVRRNNDELVAAWGNLVNRSISMAAQELRRDPGGRASSPTPTAAMLGRVAGRVRHGRRR